jgi:hypothetical protein
VERNEWDTTLNIEGRVPFSSRAGRRLEREHPEVDASHQASQEVAVKSPVLEYGHDRPPSPRIARISGWISLLAAAVFQPLDMSSRFSGYSGIALFLALGGGLYAAIATRGRSIPAWGALAAIVVNFISAAMYFNS